MIHKNMVALILAGGQGSRLGAMTRKVAKPAVPFGGKYRIIDFALSNCSNSGIDTVGILTQYKPQQLSSHIGIGTPWDLDRVHGGVAILPPYMSEAGGDWYRGTANAVYQNLGYLDQFDPSYVLILSGDHIYKMDYRKMLDAHIAAGADATIAVIDVPLEEASRFGIMNTDETGRITSFDEKPEHPKSTLASMGIYIFSYANLKKHLEDDALDPASDNDFGKNIIPAMLAAGENLQAYRFEGYWKDVGTVQSFWEANMDLLKADNDVKLFQNDWKLYTETASTPSQYIGAEAKLTDSLISEGCVILGEVEHSVIFPGVKIGRNVRVVDSIIMEDCVLEDNVIVNKSILLTGVTVKANNVVGNGADIAVIDEGRVLSGSGYLN
ncbi:MAG: glucose-1-phosphate adenylyltransferase [Clostridia bacterium]|nr:glucose-1-phosphate adenylyltransferase [Clostridia bacterium]MBQ3867808.1 glucose-1-phosphate adenylyltransferase [Clostridia bacterium]